MCELTTSAQHVFLSNFILIFIRIFSSSSSSSSSFTERKSNSIRHPPKGKKKNRAKTSFSLFSQISSHRNLFRSLFSETPSRKAKSKHSTGIHESLMMRDALKSEKAYFSSCDSINYNFLFYLPRPVGRLAYVNLKVLEDKCGSEE